MRARLLGWAGQVGIIFERKRFFERTLFEQKFSYIYTANFFFWISFKIHFFLKERLFKRTVKKKFESTKFERKKWISKEHYSINQPRPLRLSTLSNQQCDKKKFDKKYVTKRMWPKKLRNQNKSNIFRLTNLRKPFFQTKTD